MNENNGDKSKKKTNKYVKTFRNGAVAADAKKYANKVNGNPTMLLSETILGIPTTAHILGGSVMAKTADEGVINKNNEVFGYDNMYVCDGSMISANPDFLQCANLGQMHL